jgi:hypothetical protein
MLLASQQFCSVTQHLFVKKNDKKTPLDFKSTLQYAYAMKQRSQQYEKPLFAANDVFVSGCSPHIVYQFQDDVYGNHASKLRYETTPDPIGVAFRIQEAKEEKAFFEVIHPFA